MMPLKVSTGLFLPSAILPGESVCSSLASSRNLQVLASSPATLQSRSQGLPPVSSELSVQLTRRVSLFSQPPAAGGGEGEICARVTLILSSTISPSVRVM